MPFHRLSRTFYVALQYLLRYLAADACRAYYKVLVKELQVLMVGAGASVESIYPRTADETYQVLVAVEVLCQHNEMPSAAVYL